jgi:hypothetical protein
MPTIRLENGIGPEFDNRTACYWIRSLKTLSARNPSTAFRERESEGGIWGRRTVPKASVSSTASRHRGTPEARQ